MKYILSQVAYLVTDREQRANIRALLGYLLFLAVLVALYTVLFHIIKTDVEAERHSWLTGLYWTLTVMTTLGFGDITFTSDTGRFFSIIVLLSGVVFLLVMLPFLFIRLFYAPWLEARVRLRAPREVPRDVSGHLIIAEYDAIAVGLIERLRGEPLKYYVVEPDPVQSAKLVGEGVHVVRGENDSRRTYESMRAGAARLVLANCEDTVNTNITLTTREVAPDVAIAAIAEEDDSVDILHLAGATTVLPLKSQLGEYLANRVAAGRAEAHVIGTMGDLQIAEVPARDTQFAGLTVRDTHLRQRTGLNIVGFWERGRLRPAYPHSEIKVDSVIVVTGGRDQIDALNRVVGASSGSSLVIVIGAGKVGQAAARALQRKGLTVHAIDKTAQALESIRNMADAVYAGDAADRALLEHAGINSAASVLLTTNDDAMNIYLAVYCRRLNPNLRIVSRITHERNVEAIHRAGADFALSYTSLGVEAILALLHGRDPVLVGEGVELFTIRVPDRLANRALRDSAIGSDTGLSVVAVKIGDRLLTQLTAETVLPAGADLLMLGNREQRRTFADNFE